ACDGNAGSLASNYAAVGTSATHHPTRRSSDLYTVNGRIFDKNDGYTEYSTTVVVHNVAPAVTAPNDQNSDEGSSKSFDLGTFTDPGTHDNPWKVHVDWGDSSSSNEADRSTTGSAGTASHTYDDNGTYTVLVKVTDKDGASGDASFKVTVANVPPTATPGNDGPVDEGSAAAIAFAA